MKKIRYLIIGLVIIAMSNSFTQTDTLSSLINKALEVSPKLKMLEMKKLAASKRVERTQICLIPY